MIVRFADMAVMIPIHLTDRRHSDPVISGAGWVPGLRPESSSARSRPARQNRQQNAVYTNNAVPTTVK
jgi:hypothetical protein